jgi:tetratricopeptide (TPR) repeat protein
MSSSVQKAASLKDEGNKFFTAGQYEEALAKYQMAIALDATQVVYHSNASQCLLNIKFYSEAYDAANMALALDPKHVKSLVRRAAASKALSHLSEACTDLTLASKLEPTNQNIISELNIVTQALSLATAEPKKSPLSSSSSPTIPSQSSKPTLSALEQAKIALTNTTPDLPQPAISFGEFELHWRTLSSHPSLLDTYLKSIEPTKLKSIFKDMMTADMLYTWLQTVSNLVELSDTHSLDHAKSILVNLSQLQRFSLIRMFFSSDQVQLIKSIFSKLEASLPSDSQISTIKAKFL